MRKAAFKKLAFQQLVANADPELLSELIGQAIPSRIAGFCEWVSDTAPVVSVGFDWHINDEPNRVAILSNAPRTNLMMVNAKGYDYGPQRTSRFLLTWINTFLRPRLSPLARQDIVSNSSGWRGGYLSILDNLTTEMALYKQVERRVRALGFDYTAYGIRMAFPIIRPTVWTHNNYPEEWQRRYAEKDYVDIDPTVQRAIESPLPMVWSDALFEDQPEFWRDAQRHGLRFGWAQSSRDATGSVGLLSVARRDGPITDAELQEKQHKLSMLVQITHAGMSRIMAPALAPGLRATVTSGEREILRWTAEGKTSAEIASILELPERTVTFRRTAVIRKLGAVNITQATVMAFSLGMIC